MEAETSLVRADSAVILYAVAEVYMDFTVVINPRYTESDDTLWLYETLDNLSALKLRMLIIYVFHGFEYLTNCLKVFIFTWVLGSQVLHNFLYVHGYGFRMLLVLDMVIYYFFF